MSPKFLIIEKSMRKVPDICTYSESSAQQLLVFVALLYNRLGARWAGIPNRPVVRLHPYFLL